MARTVEEGTSAAEEQRQQEYQHAHVQQYSAATSSSFQCNNCQGYADPERVRYDCPHRESLFKVVLKSNTRKSPSATKDSH